MGQPEYRVPAMMGAAELEAKGSVFYGVAARVESEAEVQALLANARAAHPEASHHALAYRLGPRGESARFGDDGEPGGTAGRPMMEVLLREGLVYAAVIVSRHFGGTLLGAGGLVRAYGGAAAAAVRAAGATVMSPHERLRLSVDYARLGAVQQEIRLANLRPPDEEFGAVVTLTIAVPTDEVERFRARIADVTAGQVTMTVLGTLYLPR